MIFLQDQYEFLHDALRTLLQRYLDLMEDHYYQNIEVVAEPPSRRSICPDIPASPSTPAPPSPVNPGVPPPRPARLPSFRKGGTLDKMSFTDKSILDNLRQLEDANVSRMVNNWAKFLTNYAAEC